jgi:hypothetical protein
VGATVEAPCGRSGAISPFAVLLWGLVPHNDGIEREAGAVPGHARRERGNSLGDAVVGGLIAAAVPIVFYIAFVARRFGNLEKGLAVLERDRGETLAAVQEQGQRLERNRDELRSDIREQAERLEKYTDKVGDRVEFEVGTLSTRLEDQGKELIGIHRALDTAIADMRVEVVERIAQAETRLVDRIGQLEGEIRSGTPSGGRHRSK